MYSVKQTWGQQNSVKWFYEMWNKFNNHFGSFPKLKAKVQSEEKRRKQTQTHCKNNVVPFVSNLSFFYFST